MFVPSIASEILAFLLVVVHVIVAFAKEDGAVRFLGVLETVDVAHHFADDVELAHALSEQLELPMAMVFARAYPTTMADSVWAVTWIDRLYAILMVRPCGRRIICTRLADEAVFARAGGDSELIGAAIVLVLPSKETIPSDTPSALASPEALNCELNSCSGIKTSIFRRWSKQTLDRDSLVTSRLS